MSTLVDSQSLIIDNLLQFEKECVDITSRNELVVVFCQRVIPFLQKSIALKPLIDRWRQDRECLNYDYKESEKTALDKFIKIFEKVRRRLGADISDTLIKRIARVENTIKGKEGYLYILPPLHDVVFDELKYLFNCLLNEGYTDLCERFVKIGTVREYDPSIEKWVDNPCVSEYTFAECLEDVSARRKAILWDQVHDPVVVWWYFESALWFWNTPKSYFDTPRPKLNTKKACEKHAKALGSVGGWSEIASVQDKSLYMKEPIIFTDRLFKQGLLTVITAVREFFSSLCQNKELGDREVTVELSLDAGDKGLDRDALWLSVIIAGEATKKYCLKKFNDGQRPYEFIKLLFDKYPKGGEVEVDLRESESIPKFIGRLGFTGELKKIFFGRSQGNRVMFKGTILTGFKKNIKHRLVSDFMKLTI